MAMTGLFRVFLNPPNFSSSSGISSLLPRRTWSTVVVKSMSTNNTAAIPIMVNSCTGQMGKAVIEVADSAGLQIVPVSLGSTESSGNTVQICGKQTQMLVPEDRESVLASLLHEHPNLIVVDFTVLEAVNVSLLASLKYLAELLPGNYSGYSMQEHSLLLFFGLTVDHSFEF